MLSWIFFFICQTEPKFIYYFDYTNAANENCVEFCMNEFSSVGREEWCNKMKNGQKLKLRDAHVTPRNIQEVQPSKLGDAHASPFINKSTRSSLNALYFYCFIYNVLFLEHIYFCLLFSLVLFLFCLL